MASQWPVEAFTDKDFTGSNTANSEVSAGQSSTIQGKGCWLMMAAIAHKAKRPDCMVGALLLLWMNQSMLNKIPSAVFTLVGLLRLSGIVLARSNLSTLEAISAPNKSALASTGVTGAAIAGSAVIVGFRYGFGEGSSTTTQPAACIPDKQKAAIASCATDLPLQSGLTLT